MTKVDKVIKDIRNKGVFNSRGFKLTYSCSVMNKADILRSIDKIKFIVTIDGVNLTLYIEKKYLNHDRGYIGHYRYIWDGDRYNFYLPNDDVFDGKPFFTTDNTERRRLKIENIKNKLLKIN